MFFLCFHLNIRHILYKTEYNLHPAGLGSHVGSWLLGTKWTCEDLCHSQTHTHCVFLNGSSPQSRCDRSFTRPVRCALWLTGHRLHINQPIISPGRQRLPRQPRPPNPITLGEWVRGCSDWITRGWVAAPLTCCFELVMMLMFSIWPCVCLCVSPSIEPIRRLSCIPVLMANGEREVRAKVALSPSLGQTSQRCHFPLSKSSLPDFSFSCWLPCRSSRHSVPGWGLLSFPATLASTPSGPKKLLIWLVGRARQILA